MASRSVLFREPKPGRTTRCSRQVEHYGLPRYFGATARPAAELGRLAAEKCLPDKAVR